MDPERDILRGQQHLAQAVTAVVTDLAYCFEKLHPCPPESVEIGADSPEDAWIRPIAPDVVEVGDGRLPAELGTIRTAIRQGNAAQQG